MVKKHAAYGQPSGVKANVRNLKHTDLYVSKEPYHTELDASVEFSQPLTSHNVKQCVSNYQRNDNTTRTTGNQINACTI